MPIYFGFPNTKGLSVSPLLQSKKIDLLRASPWNVRAVSRPIVKQPGYASYASFLPAFMEATQQKDVLPLNRLGYPITFPVDDCLPFPHPSLVIDYGGPVPGKHTEVLSDIGFERIKMNKNENIVRFPEVTIDEVRAIRKTTPNTITPAPANTINLEAFDSWVLFLRIVSSFLSTHVYPAFRDDEHFQDVIGDLVEEITLKRKLADLPLERPLKRSRVESTDAMQVETEGPLSETGVEQEPAEINLSKAKPVKSSEEKWGSIDHIPNCSGMFFPYISELTSPDIETVPHLIEQYFMQSLGEIPAKQLLRMDKLRSAWGVIGKTESGNMAAHLSKVILLALQSQARVYPIVSSDSVYEGTVLLGGRLWVGINGAIHRPIPFDKLQQELGSFSTHSRTLQEIAEIAGLTESMLDKISCMRKLRSALLAKKLKEDDRDNIRRLAVHLHFKEKFLPVNSNTLSKIIEEITSQEDGEDENLPMHHSALFSNDKVLIALSSFGYQAPSFHIENCPKIELRGTAPTTLVVRQKPIDVACQDWKTVMETRELRNNPRNLSRANKDRSFVGNDKTVIWGKLVQMRSDTGGAENPAYGGDRVVIAGDDSVDDW